MSRGAGAGAREPEDGELARGFVMLDTLDEDAPRRRAATGTAADASDAAAAREQRLAALRRGVVGRLHTFDGPFGPRRVVYADWTASGRAYAPIERAVREIVLPQYANTHSSASQTGLQSTCFRAEARQAIAEACNANSRLDVVLFCGHGATAAVNKLVQVLGLTALGGGAGAAGASARPAVLVGPFEHHSNLLPWRESLADVFAVRENADGTGLDRAHLAELLRELCPSRPLVVGCFSAASNVSGVAEDTVAVSALLHRHGALACWDFAAAGPYLDIDMNPVLGVESADRAFAHKDAVFLSPHKFLGGVGAPGVLVVKKRLLGNAVPGATGGGSVFFVRDDSHRFLSNRVEREEAGSPDVVGAVRAGLAFRLKQAVGAAAIKELDDHLAARVRATLGAHPKIALLGPAQPPAERSGLTQLPTASFLVRHGANGLFLHYNFVCALLNDLYGIQTRGGCMCAGPYAQRLLGMRRRDVDALEAELVRDAKHCEYLRPGFSRLSLAYFVDAAEADFVLRAVMDVAELGWRLLPLYRFNPRTGEWKHKSRFTKFPGRLWLDDAELFPAPEQQPGAGQAQEGQAPVAELDYAAVLAEARALMERAEVAAKEQLGDQRALLSDSAARLLWFVMPSDALQQLRTGREPPSVAAGLDELATAMVAATATAGLATARTILEPAAYWERLRQGLTAGLGGDEEDHKAKPAPASADSTTAGAAAAAAAAAAARKTKSDLKLSSGRDKKVKMDEPETAEEPPARCGESVKSGVVCADDSCFRPRLKDKYPLRPAVAPGAAPPAVAPAALEKPEPVSSAVADLVGKREMEAATLRPKPPKGLLKQVGKAIHEWDMIRAGDRLLLGLSGGKDSLALLHVLMDLQRRSPVKFELACCTVDPMTESFDPSPLIPYLASLGVPYHYVKDPIFDKAKSGSLQGTSICSFCARMKRGALYSCAREHGYNVLVLAQHLDDLVETTLMGMLHNGHLRSMQAAYTERKGDVRVIRPLCYARERETRDFAYDAKLPVINDNCPACFQAPQERRRVKKLLAKEEATSPSIFPNLRRAILPLMDPDLLDRMEKAVLEREQRSGRGAAPNRPPGR